MISIDAYSNKNEKWTLTIEGQTPEKMTLVDIAVVYDGSDDPLESPFYLPKFTFAFLAKPDIYEAFGTVTWNSHPFSLENTENSRKWLGYLTPDVFSMPNTGYRAEVSLNAISQVEALKYIPYDNGDFNMVDTVSVITDIIYDNTDITQVSFYGVEHQFFVNSACLCMNDDDMEKVSCFEVLEWIASSLGLRIILEWNNTISLYSLPELFAKGGDDYSLLKHAGIDETFETAEVFDSVLVECKEARFQFSNIEFKLPDDRVKAHYVKINSVSIPKGFDDFPIPWVLYTRYLGYFKKDQFDGWSFPKYYQNEVEITEWWNPDKIFDHNDVPYFGAYPMVYRQGDKDWQKALVVISQHQKTYPPFNKPYAVFDKKLNINKGDYLCFDGSIICSTFSTEDVENWHIFYKPSPYQINREAYPEELWTHCPCPLVICKKNEGDGKAWNVIENTKWLYLSVECSGKWWNPELNAWVDYETKFDIKIPNQNNQGSDNGMQVPWEIPKKVDTEGEVANYFESVTGYWIELPPGYQQLVIKFYFPQSNYTDFPMVYLPDFSVKKINIFNDSDYVIRTNKKYKGGRNSGTAAFNSRSYTVYLSSYKDDINETYMSTLFWDVAGMNGVEDATYTYKYPQGGSRTFSERPEYHIIRIALYYISGMKKITDILNISDRKFTYTYKGNKLWENGCQISPLQDTAEITYTYNNTVYDG